MEIYDKIKELTALQDAANERLKAKIPDISDALQDDYEVIFELSLHHN